MCLAERLSRKELVAFNSETSYIVSVLRVKDKIKIATYSLELASKVFFLKSSISLAIKLNASLSFSKFARFSAISLLPFSKSFLDSSLSFKY